MQGLISTLLLGSLALVANTNSNDNSVQQRRNVTSLDSFRATLSNIFPSQNVPQQPLNKTTIQKSVSTQIRPPPIRDTDSAKATSSIDQQVVIQTQAKESQLEKVYTYHVPLKSLEGKDAKSQPGSFKNVEQKTIIGKKPKNEKRLAKNEEHSIEHTPASSYGNHSQQIQSGSGSGGFLHLAHPQEHGHGHGQEHEQELGHPLENHVLLQDHNSNEHESNPNLHNQQHNPYVTHQEHPEINPELSGVDGPGDNHHLILTQQGPPQEHQIVYNGQHEHQEGQYNEGEHRVTGNEHEQLHFLPHPPEQPQSHDEDEQILYPHHHQHKLPKPLKPSIVHRDPHDFYDHHDKIRTADKDHEDHHHKPNDYHAHHQQHHHSHEDVGHKSYPQDYNSVKETHGFEPYHYDMNKDPECAYKNKHFYNLTFCLEDHLYPLESILWALAQYGSYTQKLISDVTYQSADNLVTGLTRAEEEGYTYKHYFGATHATHLNLEQYKPPYHGYKYRTEYSKKGGYICPSDIFYARPRRAMNTYGQWKVIVNVDHVPKPPLNYLHGIHKKRATYSHKGYEIPKKGYTQTLRLEQCIYPNAPCSYIDPHFHSKCIQKHNFVRLVAWTLEEGLHVDTFKMPISCSCHIPQPIPFFKETSLHEERHGSVVPPINNYIHSEQGHK